jgi:hypothetical protein
LAIRDVFPFVLKEVLIESVDLCRPSTVFIIGRVAWEIIRLALGVGWSAWAVI